MLKDVKIFCKGAAEIDLDELQEFQGALKELTEENFNKLKSVILRRGIRAPIFVWDKEDDSVKFMLDGHARLKVLKYLRMLGYVIPKLPVCYINAENEKEAKEILLEIASDYGKMTKEGLDDYILNAGIDKEFIIESTSFTGLKVDSFDGEAVFVEEEIKPYNKEHILLSFSPDLLTEMYPHLEKILAIKGVEVEQSAN
jgi:DUF1365 family protein